MVYGFLSFVGIQVLSCESDKKNLVEISITLSQSYFYYSPITLSLQHTSDARCYSIAYYFVHIIAWQHHAFFVFLQLMKVQGATRFSDAKNLEILTMIPAMKSFPNFICMEPIIQAVNVTAKKDAAGKQVSYTYENKRAWQDH